MGSVHRGIPEQLALDYKVWYKLQTFVETGTFQGRTTKWAGLNFFRVHTVDVHIDYLKQAQAACQLLPVAFYHGRSEVMLQTIISRLDRPTLFWLDAHWSADLAYQQLDIVCPVLEEIEVINQRCNKQRHVVMIDDARLFGVERGWPSQKAVIDALAKGGREVSINQDVIIGVPLEQKRKDHH